MNTELIRPHVRFAAVLLALISTACSSTNAIQGKWRLVHSNMSEVVGIPDTKDKFEIELRPDGSLIFTQGKSVHKYRYRFSGKRLEIILADSTLDKTVEFDGIDRMRLIQDRKGVAFLRPIVDEYKRISP